MYAGESPDVLASSSMNQSASSTAPSDRRQRSSKVSKRSRDRGAAAPRPARGPVAASKPSHTALDGDGNQSSIEQLQSGSLLSVESAVSASAASPSDTAGSDTDEASITASGADGAGAAADPSAAAVDNPRLIDRHRHAIAEEDERDISLTSTATASSISAGDDAADSAVQDNTEAVIAADDSTPRREASSADRNLRAHVQVDATSDGAVATLYPLSMRLQPRVPSGGSTEDRSVPASYEPIAGWQRDLSVTPGIEDDVLWLLIHVQVDATVEVQVVQPSPLQTHASGLVCCSNTVFAWMLQYCLTRVVLFLRARSQNNYSQCSQRPAER